MTKFITITTCYNVMPYVEMNISMHKFQSHKNRLHVYVDDQSTDGTYEVLLSLTKDLDNFLVIRNEDNGSQAKAFMCAIEYLEKNNLIQDEDVIVEVDGDDWLSSNFVLNYLDQIYSNSSKIWMTYGQYQLYPNGNIGGHWGMSHTDYSEGKTRKYPFAYSHLKTYKYWLFNKINRDDLIDPETNTYYNAAWDHVLCIPMVEMAGHNHVYKVQDILYILNRAEDLQNEGSTRVDIQKQVEQKIRQKPSYRKL